MANLVPLPVRTAKQIRSSRVDVIFPFYHAVSDSLLPHARHLYSTRSVAEFESDLDYLCKYFEPVRMRDFLNGSLARDKGKPPLILSFDDGLIQCYQEVMPVLLKKGIPAVFFLNNDFIDNRDLFYRFKVSLLLEQMPLKSASELDQAAGVFHSRKSGLKGKLLGMTYADRDLAEKVAGLWSYSFREYLAENPVYLSSKHIHEMKNKGFEIGAHGFDHPPFSWIPAKESLEHIRQSVEDLQTRFRLDYKYFAFPFTDSGVKDYVIEDLFRSGIIEAGFGTAGLKEDRWKNYFQRVPMEIRGQNAKSILRGELNRRMLRKMLGKNKTVR